MHDEDFSDERNHATYGKYNNPHGHGHNYTLEVTVSGQVDATTGMACALAELDSTVQWEELDQIRSRESNVRPEFSEVVPTTENLGEVIFESLRQSFRAAYLAKVRLGETMMNSFEYAGGGELRR